MKVWYGARPRFRWLSPLLIAFAAACGSATDSSTDASPLAGLSGIEAVDSAGQGVTVPLSPQGAGYVRGTVLAPSAPGAGNDSLQTATRIAGVVIRIYPIIGNPQQANPTLGALQATVTTDANGRFETPVIDGSAGWHALTFTPPSGAGYQAVWARTQFWTGSSEYPWWVTLPRTP